VIDLGNHRAAALVAAPPASTTSISTSGAATVGASGAVDWSAPLVPDPATGEPYWRSRAYWDGASMAVGALAHQRGATDPFGLGQDLVRGLGLDLPMLLGGRRFRPTELVAELLTAIRGAAGTSAGPAGGPSGTVGDEGSELDRVLVTVSDIQGLVEPRRSRLIAAAEAAGFGVVELLTRPVAAVHAASSPAPGSGSLPVAPLEPNQTVLVYDFAEEFSATVVRVGVDTHDILSQDILLTPSPASVEATVTCCVDLLGRVGIGAPDWILPVGHLAVRSGVAEAVERGLGCPLRWPDDAEFAVVRGAAAWLAGSGDRVLTGYPTGERILPLAFTFPGGTARLLRWVVALEQPYDEGAVLARVRLTGGGIWDLTARTGGTLEQILVGDGAAVSSGEWLGLARP
jgi:hypothetical protein